MQTRGLFVTATDTGVGKTYLNALIARSLRATGLRVGTYKPVCSGAEIAANGTLFWSDVKTLLEAIGSDVDEFHVCPQRLQAPLAPPVAAQLEGKHLDFNSMRNRAEWWQGRVDVLLIEGVGGLLCPLTENETVADLAVAFGYPLLIVARLGLGTINHTLLTVDAARSRGLLVAGVLLNEAEPLESTLGIEENSLEIARRANVDVLGVVRHGSSVVEPGTAGLRQIDWFGLASFPSNGRKE